LVKITRVKIKSGKSSQAKRGDLINDKIIMRKKNVLNYLLKYFALTFGITICIVILTGSYTYGFLQGIIYEKQNATVSSQNFTPSEVERVVIQEIPINNSSPSPYIDTDWGGPALWSEVNSRRISYGVNQLVQKDEICTIASIRLNQLLELGKLDGHEGFSKLQDERADLTWIFEQYNLSEFLVSGVGSTKEAVDAWDGTLAHKKLLTGGEYVWGCIYAQNGFGVAIAAY